MLHQINTTEFCGYYKKHLIEIFDKLESAGLNACIVGGSVRDHLLYGSFHNDVDIEINLINKQEYSEFEDIWDNFISNFDEKYHGKYKVLKLNYEGFSAELAPARIEHFNSLKTHDNFTVELNGALKYSQSFLRRDLTINAIGVDLSDEKLINPFNGIQDLEQGIIKPIAGTFSKDPVRFLRSVRFATNNDFELSAELMSEYSKFDLSELSSFHFQSELKKCIEPINYLNILFAYIKANDVAFPVALPILDGKHNLSLYLCDLSDRQVEFFGLDHAKFKLIKLKIFH
jgi:tRNA nucleotidyltransferase (CCA-adding enzyme)